MPGVLLLLASVVVLPVLVLWVSSLDSGSAVAFTGVGRVMLYATAILGVATPAIYGIVHLCLRAWLEREDARHHHGQCRRCGYDLRASRGDDASIPLFTVYAGAEDDELTTTDVAAAVRFIIRVFAFSSSRDGRPPRLTAHP